jgi:tetratricopeptide (TPR) repeat protein
MALPPGIQPRAKQPIRSRYNAKLKKLWGARFATFSFIMVFSVFIVSTLVFLYPARFVISDVSKYRQPDRVTRQYLISMLREYPKDEKLSLLLAEQDYGVGRLKQAIRAIIPLLKLPPKREIDWQALWLYYQIVRTETYSVSEEEMLRQSGEKKIEQLIPIMANGPYTADELMNLAQQSVWLKDTSSAKMIYNRVVSMPVTESPDFYVNAAKKALEAGDYQNAAQFYFIAKQISTEPDDQKKYFVQGIKTLQSGNLLDDALAKAKTEANGWSNDKDVLLFLTQLSLAAGKPNQAEQYVKEAMQFHSQPFELPEAPK